jgi:prepilin-type N-terminal cleavage/methylation domain-containing protein
LNKGVAVIYRIKMLRRTFTGMNAIESAGACKRPSGEKGFTIIELMIVVVITAILLAVAVPNFNDFVAKGRVKNTSEAIQAFLMDAKSQSIIRDQDIYVSIGGGANWCLGWIPDPDGATTCDCADDPASCVAFVSGTQVTNVLNNANGEFPNVAIATNTNALHFDSRRGTIPAGDVGTVQISNGGWQLNNVISVMGRVKTCAPAAGANHGVTGYESC